MVLKSEKQTKYRGRVNLPLWLCAVIFISQTSLAFAAPFTPRNDFQVLEKLPFGSQGKAKRELRELKDRIEKDKGNIALAIFFAKRCIELGRQESDPRYYGYAQSVISYWVGQKNPPPEIFVLNGIIKQANHNFKGALEDLAKALEKDKSSSLAWITRAQVLQTLGDYDNAKRSCIELLRLSSQVASTSCVSLAGSLTGSAEKSYEVLKRVLTFSESSSLEELLWAETILAEISYRLGNNEYAEFHFQNAVRLKPADIYTLTIYSDYLLDQNKPKEVVNLLKNKTNVDGLLLRLAIAEKLLGDSIYESHKNELGARFLAAKLRGDSLHLREEAIYELKLQDNPKKALELATKNWNIQKEPIDARILLEASLASKNKGAAKNVLSFLEKNKLEDVRLAVLSKQVKGM